MGFCKKCGEKHGDKANYCRGCGESVTDSQKPPVPAQRDPGNIGTSNTQHVKGDQNMVAALGATQTGNISKSGYGKK
ncbi:hypothetical protein ScPMuIL_014391 [Solemya velum]